MCIKVLLVALATNSSLLVTAQFTNLEALGSLLKANVLFSLTISPPEEVNTPASSLPSSNPQSNPQATTTPTQSSGGGRRADRLIINQQSAITKVPEKNDQVEAEIFHAAPESQTPSNPSPEKIATKPEANSIPNTTKEGSTVNEIEPSVKPNTESQPVPIRNNGIPNTLVQPITETPETKVEVITILDDISPPPPSQATQEPEKPEKDKPKKRSLSDILLSIQVTLMSALTLAAVSLVV